MPKIAPDAVENEAATIPASATLTALMQQQDIFWHSLRGAAIEQVCFRKQVI